MLAIFKTGIASWWPSSKREWQAAGQLRSGPNLLLFFCKKSGLLVLKLTGVQGNLACTLFGTRTFWYPHFWYPHFLVSAFLVSALFGIRTFWYPHFLVCVLESLHPTHPRVSPIQRKWLPHLLLWIVVSKSNTILYGQVFLYLVHGSYPGTAEKPGKKKSYQEKIQTF